MTAVVTLDGLPDALRDYLQATRAARFGAEGDQMVLSGEHREVTPDLIVAANMALSRYEPELRPLTGPALRSAVVNFAEIVNAAVANPVSGEALKVRCVPLELAGRKIPGCAWKSDAALLAVERFKFFPSVAEAVEVLQEACAPVREQVAALRVLVMRAEIKQKYGL